MLVYHLLQRHLHTARPYRQSIFSLPVVHYIGDSIFRHGHFQSSCQKCNFVYSVSHFCIDWLWIDSLLYEQSCRICSMDFGSWNYHSFHRVLFQAHASCGKCTLFESFSCSFRGFRKFLRIVYGIPNIICVLCRITNGFRNLSCIG